MKNKLKTSALKSKQKSIEKDIKENLDKAKKKELPVDAETLKYRMDRSKLIPEAVFMADTEFDLVADRCKNVNPAKYREVTHRKKDEDGAPLSVDSGKRQDWDRAFLKNMDDLMLKRYGIKSSRYALKNKEVINGDNA